MQPRGERRGPTWVRLRRARPLLISLALHGAFALVLAWLKPRPLTVGAAVPIEVTMPAARKVERAPEPARAGVQRPPRPAGSAATAPGRRRNPKEREQEQEPPAQPEREPSGSGSGSGSVNPEPAGPAPNRPIDLFSSGALDKAVPFAPSTGGGWGGHTRRLGDGQGDPNARDKAADREEAAARVSEWIGDAQGQERARSGNVAPRWREAERRVTEGFKPPIEIVKQDSVGKTFAKQMLRAWQDGPPAGGPVERGVDPSAGLPGLSPGANFGADLPMQQTMASQAANAKPQGWLRVEVEVVLDEKGHIASTRVLRGSGRRRFDESAVKAVTDAILKGGPPEEGRAVVTRWSVEATVKVTPPNVAGFSFDESGTLRGGSGASRFIQGSYPMKQDVVTRVALLSVRPR